MNVQKLKVVDKFTYLGSTISRAVYIDEEVTARFAKASVAFKRLHANVWNQALHQAESLQGSGTANPLVLM